MEPNDETLRELRLIRGLLSAQLTQGLLQKDAIRILHDAGMMPLEIAGTIGTTPNNVNVTLSALRKEGKVKKAR